MSKLFIVVFNTLKHLKPKQLQYQLLYRIKKAKNISEYRIKKKPSIVYTPEFIFNAVVSNSYLGKNKFRFLNLEHDFGQEIDWKFSDYGALWNYNLQYLNVLLQDDIAVPEKERILKSLYASGVVLEPYPVSLRSINVIRFLSAENIHNPEILENLYAELNFLSQRLEFHLLGNHLLENAFALMMGGAFFGNKSWIQKAQKILEDELEEQILADGAHFELSAMYHQIILFRVLELYDWYGKWNDKDGDFEHFLKTKAEMMLAWLEHISFQNGDIPHFNDSANGIAFRTDALLNYGKDLKLTSKKLPLKESGYRSVNMEQYELRIDFAQIGASYQPGHVHADALSFILYYQHLPLFVEQGTSTYNIGKRRSLERSTEAHNTVVVGGENQSQVWSGFRVGKRAKTTILEGANNRFKAFHDGYKKRGVIHTRTFLAAPEQLVIEDDLKSNTEGVFHLHLHPDRMIRKESPLVYRIDEKIRIEFHPGVQVAEEDYQYSESYNKYQAAWKLVVTFVGKLQTTIRFE